MYFRRLLCFLPLLLASCVTALSADTTVALRASENWVARADLVFTPAQVQLSAGQLDPAFSQLVANMKANGIKSEFEKTALDNGNTSYKLSAEGQGLEKLNTAFFNSQAALYVDESAGERRVVFSYYAGLPFAQQETFTLVGGKIISTNGIQMDSHTITWVNPTGTMEAVLTEAPAYPAWLPYALVGAGGVLLVVAAIGVIRMRGQASRVGSPLPVISAQAVNSTQFCSNCGAALPAESMFCPTCGKKR
jgi:hypothetical protein